MKTLSISKELYIFTTHPNKYYSSLPLISFKTLSDFLLKDLSLIFIILMKIDLI